MTYVLKKKIGLIGIFGNSGAGKDTVGDYIAKNYENAYTLAFADALKHAAMAAFGLPVECFYDSERKIECSEFWNVTPRKIGQFFGTELFREKIQELLPEIGNDFWIKRIVGAIDGELTDPWDPNDSIYLDEKDTVVITDGRFNNELDFILANRGVAIHLDRSVAPMQGGIANHASEILNFNTIFKTHKDYHVIHNNGTKGDLYAEVDRVLSLYPQFIASN